LKREKGHKYAFSPDAPFAFPVAFGYGSGLGDDGMMARSYFKRARAIGLLILALALLCQGQPGRVIGWGTSPGGPYAPKPGDEYMAICGGGYHSLALQADGTVVAWGDNSRGQCNVPPRTKFLAIAAGTWHSLGIRLDGTLVAWGWNDQKQCDVPAGHDYIDIAGGFYHSVALKVDRSLVAWGSDGDGQCEVPPGNDFVDIAAGSLHSLALRADGTIAAWGRRSEGQCKVPAGGRFIAIAAGALHSLALRADGTVVAWGANEYAQCDTPETSGVAFIAAGGFHSLAICEDRPPAARPGWIDVPPAQPAPGMVPTKGAATAPTSALKPEPIKALPPVTSQPTDAVPSLSPVSPRALAPTQMAQSHPIEMPQTSQPSEQQTHLSPSGPTQMARPGQPPVLPLRSEESQAATQTRETPDGVTISGTDPNIPLDLNDPIRQGLAANLYLDAGQQAVPVYHFTSTAPAPGEQKGAATSPDTKQHFCTIDEQEKYKLIDTQSDVWKYDGIAFFAYPEGHQPPGARPVYRFWSQRLNRYFFTMDENLKQILTGRLANAWRYDGIAWYAPAAKPSGSK
jgi:hypothetical protein